jgi:hypothetical protein
MTSSDNRPPESDDSLETRGRVPKSPISRRAFVLTGSGMLVAAGTEACISEGLRNDRGAVRVVLSGLGANAPDGGTARIRRARDGETMTITVPVIGDETVPADVGEYSVEYTPPTGYQLISGQSNTRTIAVETAATATIAFTVVELASVGVLDVAVAGLVAVAQGGTATAQRTDAAGAPRIIPISAAGTGSNSTIPVGTYTVTYTPPAGFNDVSGANPVTGAAVSTGTTTSVSFAVAAAPGTVQVTVSGLTGASSGGQVSAIKTDNSGATFTEVLPAPANDSSAADLTGLPPGTYNVSYVAPAGYRLTAVTPVVRIVVVNPGGTSSTSFGAELIPPTTGSVNVTASGLGGATSGGQVTAARTDGTGSTFNLSLGAPIGGTSSGAFTGLPLGTYNIAYVPPAGYELVSPSFTPQVVTVTAGVPPTAAFSLAQIPVAPGAIHVAITGLTGSIAGGQASARRSDNTGTTFTLNLPAPTGDASAGDFTNLPPASYNVTYLAPGGYRLVNPTQSPQTVNVTTGATSNADFVTEVAPPNAGVVFNSDWSTALGNTANAKTDGGKWNVLADNSGGLEVVAGAALGFPSTNCLRVIAQQGNTGFHRVAKTGLGVVAPGESVWFRWYYRNEQPLTDDSSQHPIESGQSGGLEWAFNNEVQSNTTWFADFQSPGDSLTFRQRWRGPLLQSSTLYRFEMQLHKLSTTTWNLHVRVYDAANVLIASDADYRNVFSSGGVGAGTVRLADNPTLNFSTTNGSQMDELRAGCNGIGGTDWFPSLLYAYQGCFAVSRSDWLGPYNPTTGV